MGSLMDGIEIGPAGAKQGKNATSSSDGAKYVKLAIAGVGLVVGGALIAWNLGWFGEAVPPQSAAAATPLAPSSPPPTVRKVAPPRAIDAPQVRQPQNELIEQGSR